MKSAVWAGVVLSLAGCGGDDDPGCALADRAGTFVLRQDVISGDCGLLPDEVVTITDPTFPGRTNAGVCTLLSTDLLSTDECIYKRHISCVGTDGSSIETIGETTQQDPDGNSITGEASITLRDSGGIPICSGRYRLTFERR